MRLTVIIATLLFTSLLNAQEWIVPADRKARLSPFQFTPADREAGKTLYNANCMSCHGNPTQNNWLRDLDP